MTWLKRLVGGLPPPRTGLDPRSVHVRFMVDRAALGQVFLRVLLFVQSFYRCSVLTFIYTLLLPEQTGEIREPSKPQYFIGNRGVFGMIKSRMRLAAPKEINFFWKLRDVWEGVDYIQPAQDGNKPSRSTKCHGFNHLKPTGYVMHHQFNIQQLYALPTLYLCVLYLSENKQRLVPLTA